MRQVLLYVFILLVCNVSAEQFKITGKVVEAEKDPLIGTTVQIKGTDRRIAADIDGNFSIDVEKGAILRFSYVGYHSKEVEVLNDSSLFIELEEDENHINPDNIIIIIGTGPSQCPCNHHTMIRERIKRNQNNAINH